MFEFFPRCLATSLLENQREAKSVKESEDPTQHKASVCSGSIRVELIRNRKPDLLSVKEFIETKFARLRTIV